MRQKVIIRFHDGSEIKYTGDEFDADAIRSDFRDSGVSAITLQDVGDGVKQMFPKSSVSIITFGALYDE